MSIVTETYTRKSFEIEAIRITKENFEEAAEWCGGEIQEFSGKPYIKVDVIRPLTEKQTRGFVGDWLLKAGSGFKVYKHRAFVNCFVKKSTNEQPPLFELQDDGVTAKPVPRIHAGMPKSYPQPSTR